MTGTELTVPALRGLSLREVWDLEDKFDDAKALVSDYIDSEIRRLVGDGWTSRKIAEEVRRDQSTVTRRCARIGVQLSDPRGGDRKSLMRPHQNGAPMAGQSAEPRYPDIVQFGVPAETQETMAASLDAMPEPEREESLAKIRGEHGSWERKNTIATLAGLPPMPRPVPDPDAAKASERRQASENLTHCLIPLNPDPLPPVEFADRFVASLGDEFAAFDAARIQKAGEVLLALARRRTEWQ